MYQTYLNGLSIKKKKKSLGPNAKVKEKEKEIQRKKIAESP